MQVPGIDFNTAITAQRMRILVSNDDGIFAAGLAPLVGILRQMRLTGDNRGVHLIYSNREAAQIAFREELGTAGVTHVLSEPPEGWTGETGVVNAALLGRVLTGDQVDGWLFLICGPPAMITGVEDALIARGVSADRILSERFDYD